MEVSIQKLAALVFFVVSVSHIAQPRAWAEFFISLREQGKTGTFANGFIHFPLGALVVSFHNVWTWPEVVLTVAGWGLVVKSLLSFVHPRIAMRSLERVSVERAWEFAVAGVLGLGFAAFCLFLALRRA
jgi:hypothetical protein